MRSRSFGFPAAVFLCLLFAATPVLSQPAEVPAKAQTAPLVPVAKSQAAPTQTTIGDLAEVVFEEVYPKSEGETELMLVLRSESYLNASLVAKTVQKELGEETQAKPMGGLVIRVKITEAYKDRPVDFAAALQATGILGAAERTGETKSPVRVLINLLDSNREPAVRMNAALALASTGSIRAFEALEKTAEDKDPWVKRCVALALARFEKSEAENLQANRDGYITQVREALSVIRKSSRKTDDLNEIVRRLDEHLEKANDLFPVEEEVVRLRNPETRRELRTLVEMIQKIQTFYPDDEKTRIEVLLQAAGRGLTAHLDKFSRLVDKTQVRDMNQGLAGKYVGIGVLVAAGDPYPLVTAPLYSGPAYAAGIRSFDRIVAVDGDSTKRVGPSKLAEMIRGEPETPVTITVSRPSFDKPRDFLVTRKGVTMDAVTWEKMPGGIGYIRIVQFGPAVPAELDQALANLKKQDALKGLVVDLRNNPGGLVTATAAAVSRFIGSNALVSTLKGKYGEWEQPQEIRTPEHSTPWKDFPMVILINGNSASGSEMFSGSLRDHGRATLIGERTYGKGSGQTALPLIASRGQRYLYMTVFKYYLPKGESIHETGIAPNIMVPGAPYTEWKAIEAQKILTSNVLTQYAYRWIKKKHELFTHLAVSDDRDPSNYPDFEALFKQLNSKLPRTEVRKVVRNVLRNMIADEQGVAFHTDVQEDRQLQRAVMEIAKKINLDLDNIARYSQIEKSFEVKSETEPVLVP